MTQSRNNLSLIQYFLDFYVNFIWLADEKLLEIISFIFHKRENLVFILVFLFFFQFCVRGSRTSKALVSLHTTMFNWKAHGKFSRTLTGCGEKLSQYSLGVLFSNVPLCMCRRERTREYASIPGLWMRKKYILWQLCKNLMLALRQGYLSALNVLVLNKDAGGITGIEWESSRSLFFYSRKKNFNDFELMTMMLCNGFRLPRQRI